MIKREDIHNPETRMQKYHQHKIHTRHKKHHFNIGKDIVFGSLSLLLMLIIWLINPASSVTAITVSILIATCLLIIQHFEWIDVETRVINFIICNFCYCMVLFLIISGVIILISLSFPLPLLICLLIASIFGMCYSDTVGNGKYDIKYDWEHNKDMIKDHKWLGVGTLLKWTAEVIGVLILIGIGIAVLYGIVMIVIGLVMAWLFIVFIMIAFVIVCCVV